MGTIIASNLIGEVEEELFDATNLRWSPSELLSYLNEAHKIIVGIKPDVLTKNVSLSVTGLTKLSLPVDGNVFIDVVCNMGSSGTTRGKAIRFIPMQELNQSDPDWMTKTGTEVKRWTRIDGDRRNVYLYPRVTSAHQIETVYSVTPNVIADNEPIVLDDVYAPVIKADMKRQAFQKETEMQNFNKSLVFAQQVSTLLGVQQSQEIDVSGTGDK